MCEKCSVQSAAQAFRVSRRAKQTNWTATLYCCICICVCICFFFVFLVFARSFQTGFVRLLLKCTTIQYVKSMPVIHKEKTVLIQFGIFVKD